MIIGHAVKRKDKKADVVSKFFTDDSFLDVVQPLKTVQERCQSVLRKVTANSSDAGRIGDI